MTDHTSDVAVPELSPGRLRDLLAEGQPVTVLDIRPQDEFEEWRIPGSENWPVYNQLKEDREADLRLPAGARGRPMVTVCGAGKTSKEAASLLREAGREAYSLSGGLRAWTFAWNVAGRTFPAVDAEILQVRRTGKGCLSYVVGSAGEALVIDPALRPDVYEEMAVERGWQIVGVADTHIHADHLSRARRLADRTGALLYLPAQDRVTYEFQPISEGDPLPVGGTHLTAHQTPGHTPEHMVYELDGEALFTGDTLFTHGVGRPDLDADAEGGRKKARQLYRSLMELARFPIEMVVLPGHVSRPVGFDEGVLGAPLGDVQEGTEVLSWSEDQFVEQILERIPPTPPNHETIIARNKTGKWPGDREEVMRLEAGANRCAVE